MMAGCHTPRHLTDWDQHRQIAENGLTRQTGIRASMDRHMMVVMGTGNFMTTTAEDITIGGAGGFMIGVIIGPTGTTGTTMV